MQVIASTASNPNQTNITLRTSSSAETFNGGKLDGQILTGPSSVTIMLALFYIKDGQAVPTLSIVTGAGPKPETSCLWWKLWVLPPSATTPLTNGDVIDIKTKRKMMPGDTLVLSAIGSGGTNNYVATFTGFMLQ